MSRGLGKAALIGAAVALVLVAAIAAAAFLGVIPTSAEKNAAVDESTVLVALVLPDADGVLTVRVLDRYTHADGPLSVSAVDPLAATTVPGTSATTLAEAYQFGGGDGLAAAYALDAGVERPAWVVVGPRAWADLMGPGPISLRLDDDIEVFDGTELYSYPAGTTLVPATQTALLMNGAAYLDQTGTKAVRQGVGDALAPVFLRADVAATRDIDTNLTPEQWAVWLRGVSTQPVRADTNN